MVKRNFEKWNEKTKKEFIILISFKKKELISMIMILQGLEFVVGGFIHLEKKHFSYPKQKIIWEVKVHVNDILDHDGQKMRIRGGEFKILEEVK